MKMLKQTFPGHTFDMLSISILGRAGVFGLLDNKKFGPYPRDGGFERLAQDLYKHDPKLGSPDDILMKLVILHASFIRDGFNLAGMEYPVVLVEERKVE